MDFESAGPSIVKSIKQRDLLNNWLRLFVKEQRVPRLDEYHPDRIEDEKPDLVYFDVVYDGERPKFKLTYHGHRLADAFGVAGEGLWVEDVIGPIFAPTTMPIYDACVARQRPMYSIFVLVDAEGREVAYERLILPFCTSDKVDLMIASCKMISDENRFQQRDLLRANAAGPGYMVIAVIDKDMIQSKPHSVDPDDVIASNPNERS